MADVETNVAKKAVVPLRSELKRLTREHLISVAMQLFETEGYRATSVARIVHEAGTTAPTFYRHFKNKSDLLRVISKYLSSKVGESLKVLDQIKRPSRVALREWLDVYGAMWQRVHRLCDAYWEGTVADADLAAEALPATFQITELMENMLRGLAPKPRAKMHMRLVIVSLLMDRFMHIAECAKGTKTYDAMMDEFAEMLWQVLFDRAR